MKSLKIFAAFLFLILSQNLFAQEPDPESFFPHAVGNVWEYDTPTGIQKFEILSDSIDPNHNIFIYLNRYPSYKIDTNNNVYRLSSLSQNMWLDYKLAADSADYWLVDSITYWFARVSNVYSIAFGGKERIIKEIEYGISLGSVFDPNYFWVYTIETLAEGIGLVYKWNEEDPQGPQKVLLGCVIDGDTLGVLTSIEDNFKLPDVFLLSQNYPNPFNPTTTIKYSIPSYKNPFQGGARGGLVTLKIYDILGNEVAVLVNEEKSPGEYEVIFNASNLSSGVYYYKLTAGDFTNVKKLMLLK
jgi:hypothetical protein